MFSLLLNTSKGVVNFHGISEVHLNVLVDANNFETTVVSYYTEADYLKKYKPIRAIKIYIPITAVGSNFIKSLEKYITEVDTKSPFYGGNYKSYSEDPLTSAKDKQKTLIKDYQTKDIMSIDLSASQSVIDAQVKAIKDKADVLINTINAAITVEEVLAVVW